MFTRPPDPIAGNQDFNNVENVAGQIPLLEVDALRAQSVGVNELNLNGSISDKNAYPGSVLHRVVGYAPASFGTTAKDSGVFLNKSPGLPKSLNGSAAQLLVLPVGAKLIRATLTNNGTTVTSSGSANLNVGVESWKATPNNVDVFKGALVAAATASGINNAQGVTVSANVLVLGNSGFGSSGEATAATPVTVAAGAQNVSVLVNGAALTAGDLALVIEYTM